MKKQSLQNFCLLLLITIVGGVIPAWGDTTISIGINPSNSSSTTYLTTAQTFSVDGVSFTMNNYNPSTGQIRGNQNSASSNFYLYNTTALPGNLKSIAITLDTSSSTFVDSNVYLNVGDNAITTINTSGTNPSSAAWSNLSGTYFCISMGKGGTSNTCKIKGVTITYGPSAVDPTITFTNGSLRVGQTLDLTTLFASNSSGTVTYSITSGDSYASLSGSSLTGTAVGSVTVKAEQAAAGNYNAGEATATVTVNEALTLSSIAITTPPTKTSYIEGEAFDATGMVVTATYSNESTENVTASCTFSPSGALTTGDSEITVSYTEGNVTKTAVQSVTVNELPKYTVTFSDGGSVTQATAGASVTLPSREAVEEYTFAGWSTTEVATETTTVPTIIPAGSYTPTANITLYPVYTKTEASGESVESWIRISSVPEDGYYAICGGTSTTLGNIMSSTVESNRFANGSPSPSLGADGNSLSKAPANNCVWEIYKAADNYFRIKQGDNFAAATGSNNQGKLLTDETDNYAKWTISYSSNTFTIENVGMASANKNKTLRNNSSYGWGTYAASTGDAPILFKKTTTQTVITYYFSNPVAAAVERPEITVAENPFHFSTTVTMTCGTEGAAIKYSYDGETWNDYSEALTITETKTIYAKGVKGEDESNVAQVTATKNLAEPTVTVSGDLTLDLDGETNVSAGTLTAAVTYNDAAVGGATVTWSSSDTDIAEINASSGAVTIKARGEVTFTATYAANSDYAEATGTKTVTIVDSKAPGTVARPYTVAEAIEAIDNDGDVTGVYVEGIISQIDSYNSTYHSITYWISTDGTTTDQFEVYSGKGINGANFSSKNDIELGARVVIKGDIKLYNSTTYEFNSGSQMVSYTPKPASDLTKVRDIVLDYKNAQTEAYLTDCFTTSSDGAITYTIADGTVIENVDELISALKVGETTVTVSQAETLSYKAGEITITVTVQDTREEACEITAINIGGGLTVGNEGTIAVTATKADEGVTFSFTSSDDDILLILDDEYSAEAYGTVTVTVTATPSNTNLYKSVAKEFSVTVSVAEKSDNVLETAFDSNTTVFGTLLEGLVSGSIGYDGTIDATSSNPSVATVAVDTEGNVTITPVAVGTTDITFSAAETATFNAAADVKETITVTAPEATNIAPEGSSETKLEMDFTTNGWNLPTTDTTGPSTYTNGDYTITIDGKHKFSSSYLMLYYTNTLTFQPFNKKVTKIEIVGNSGASDGTIENIYVGETAVSTEAEGSTGTNTFVINEAYQTVGTVYSLKISKKNAQVTGINVYVEQDPSETVTLNGNGYMAYASKYPMDFSESLKNGYSAWQVTGIDGSTITFERITGAIAGGQGVLLKGDDNAEINIPLKSSTTVLEDNLLEATLAPTYFDDETIYGFTGNTFKLNSPCTLKANRAYIPANLVAGVSGTRSLAFHFVDEVTGICTRVNSATSTVVYDLQGRRMDGKGQLKSGLYIINGKKTVVR